jgi:hypothetical protein
MGEPTRPGISPQLVSGGQEAPLPPAWREFIRYCRDLRHGEIERLSIQDGLPVLAEMTRKKVKFTRDH